MRILKFTAFGLFTILLVALFLLVIGIPAGYLAESIRTQFAAKTGYELQIDGGATINVRPSLSIVMRDIRLINPNGGAAQNQLTIESARMEISLASLLTGRPDITELALRRPILKVPVVRRATGRESAAQLNDARQSTSEVVNIKRVYIEDASVLFVTSPEHVESRIDHINISTSFTVSNHQLEAKIDGHLGSQVLHIQIKGSTPNDKLKPFPMELTLDAPGLLQGTMSSRANVTSSDALLKINDLEGQIGKDKFTGWASVDLTNKPQVKLDLDFKRLNLMAAAGNSAETARPSNIDDPWNSQEIDLDGLNFVDAEIAFSASELNVSTLHFAPVSLEASLSNGLLKVDISKLGLYGGSAEGILILDASGLAPQQTIRMNLSGVRALPLLSELAHFQEIDGTMKAKIEARAVGTSQRDVMSTLSGSVDVLFQDGEIRHVNVAQLVRRLTQNVLSGWQEDKAGKTDLTELSALFRIDSGRATTDNLRLVGPLVRVNGTGAAYLAEKTLQFKLDTKLVLSLEGQGGAVNPVGFGVPVMVEGKWGSPRIYPDMAGILENPEAVYEKLRALGIGLFGKSRGDEKSATEAGSSMHGLGGLLGGQGNDPNGSQSQGGSGKQTPIPDTQSWGDLLRNIFGK
jgi:AsmA protein